MTETYESIPKAVEAETAVLGACFIDPSAMVGSREMGVTAGAFYVQLHAIVFAAMNVLFDAGTEINEITVLERVRADEPEFALDLSDLISISNAVESTTSARYFAKLVVDAWKKRELIRHSRAIAELAHTPGDSFDDVRKAMQVPLTQLGSLSVQEESTDIVERAEEFIERKRKEFAGQVEEVPDPFRVYMGMPVIERELGYIDRRDNDNFIVIGAPRSRGKSTHMRQIANINLVKHPDWNVIYFILEGDVMRNLHHMACGYVRIPNRDHFKWMNDQAHKGAMAARKAADKMKRYFEHMEFLKSCLNKRLFMIERDQDIDSIVARARELSARLGVVDLILVDYVQKIQCLTKGANREQQVSEVSGKLSLLQVSMSCPLVTGSQLNKEGDARESMAIENDATRFLQHSRPAKDQNGTDQSEGERVQYYQVLYQKKERNGPLISLGYNFNCQCSVMLDPAAIPEGQRGRPKKETGDDAVSF
jgi:replicative DNA helicase